MYSILRKAVIRKRSLAVAVLHKKKCFEKTMWHLGILHNILKKNCFQYFYNIKESTNQNINKTTTPV